MDGGCHFRVPPVGRSLMREGKNEFGWSPLQKVWVCVGLGGFAACVSWVLVSLAHAGIGGPGGLRHNIPCPCFSCSCRAFWWQRLAFP